MHALIRILTAPGHHAKMTVTQFHAIDTGTARRVVSLRANLVKRGIPRWCHRKLRHCDLPLPCETPAIAVRDYGCEAAPATLSEMSVRFQQPSQ